MSLPRDESIIIFDFSQSMKSSVYLSISYDKLAVTALLFFYNILNAVVIKVNAVTKMGTKVNKKFDFFFFQRNAEDFSFCAKNDIFILSLRGQICFGITVVYSFRRKDGWRNASGKSQDSS